MSDNHGGFSHLFTPIVRPNCEDAQVSLTELSERDKPWEKHRRNADIVSGYYRQGGMRRHADRVALCSRLLEFKLIPDGEAGLQRLKLTSAQFCRVRHCPICQWRRSLIWKAKAYQALPSVVADYPNGRWLFLTLTMRNCELTDLRETLHHLNHSFRRLTQLKAFPGIGWVKSVEVTRGKDGCSAHPHLHCLILLNEDYFKSDYLSKSDWITLWKQCLRVNYSPILDVKAIHADSSPVGLIAEILKYQCKESDLVASPNWFIEYVNQVHGTRAVGVGGVLRKYFQVLEEEPEDLIGHDEETNDEVDEGLIYFRWNPVVRRYILLSNAPSNTWMYPREGKPFDTG